MGTILCSKKLRRYDIPEKKSLGTPPSTENCLMPLYYMKLKDGKQIVVLGQSLQEAKEREEEEYGQNIVEFRLAKVRDVS